MDWMLTASAIIQWQGIYMPWGRFIAKEVTEFSTPSEGCDTDMNEFPENIFKLVEYAATNISHGLAFGFDAD